jgi:hypothetical protein
MRNNVRRRRGNAVGKTREQLGTILRRMYDEAPTGEKVANIHLFAIKHAADIKDAGLTAGDVVKAAGIRTSYGAEVSKGINLAKYVVPKSQYA